MNTLRLFERLPDTKDEALALLRAFHAAGLSWHLDDDPEEIVRAGGERVFTDAEGVFLSLLVERLNELFADDVPEGERECGNAGGWAAVTAAGWLD